MSPPVIADLRPGNGIYRSSRAKWDVLIGEDSALPIIEAVASGDDAGLQSLLSQPHWIKTMFEEPHFIHSEDRQSQGPDDVRGVLARPESTLRRAMIIAAVTGHASIVSTLLAFAAQQGVDPVSLIDRPPLFNAIRNGHAAVIEVMLRAEPKLVNYRYLGHDTRPIYEAVRLKQPEVAALLLRHGADPLHPVGRYKTIGSYGSSLMSHAAMCKSPRMIELLLEHDVPIAGSAALHTAATCGRFDNARLLMQHGADVNERIPKWKGWTPMHFAGWRRDLVGMDFLEKNGGERDAKDDTGMTAAQVMAESTRELGLS